MSGENEFDVFLNIRKGRHDFNNAKEIAENVLDPHQYGKFDYYKKSAFALLVCALLHALYTRKGKILRNAFNILRDTKQSIYSVLDSMMLTQHDHLGRYNWVDPITKNPTRTHPVVFSIARELKRKDAEELSIFLNIVLAHINLYTKNVMWDCSNDDDFIVSITIQGAKLQTTTITDLYSNMHKYLPLSELLLKDSRSI